MKLQPLISWLFLLCYNVNAASVDNFYLTDAKKCLGFSGSSPIVDSSCSLHLAVYPDGTIRPRANPMNCLGGTAVHNGALTLGNCIDVANRGYYTKFRWEATYSRYGLEGADFFIGVWGNDWKMFDSGCFNSVCRASQITCDFRFKECSSSTCYPNAIMYTSACKCQQGFYEDSLLTSAACHPCRSCSAGTVLSGCSPTGQSPGSCIIDDCRVAQGLPNFNSSKVLPITDMIACRRATGVTCNLHCQPGYLGHADLKCTRTGWSITPCFKACVNLSDHCEHAGCLWRSSPPVNAPTCADWKCPDLAWNKGFETDKNISWNRIIDVLNIGSNSDNIRTLRAVSTCAMKLAPNSASRMADIRNVFHRITTRATFRALATGSDGWSSKAYSSCTHLRTTPVLINGTDEKACKQHCSADPGCAGFELKGGKCFKFGSRDVSLEYSFESTCFIKHTKDLYFLERTDASHSPDACLEFEKTCFQQYQMYLPLYTCVGSWCAGINPMLTPPYCTSQPLVGFVVDNATGRCVEPADGADACVSSCEKNPACRGFVLNADSACTLVLTTTLPIPPPGTKYRIFARRDKWTAPWQEDPQVVGLALEASSFAAGYFDRLSEFEIPVLNKEYFETQLQNKAVLLKAVYDIYASCVTAQSFNELFQTEKSKTQAKIQELEDSLTTNAKELKLHIDFVRRDSDELQTKIPLVHKKVEALQEAIKINAIFSIITACFECLVSIFSMDFAKVGTSLGTAGKTISTLREVAGAIKESMSTLLTRFFDVFKTMADLMVVVRELEEAFEHIVDNIMPTVSRDQDNAESDIRMVENAPTQAKWDAMQFEISGILDPTCYGDSGVETECFQLKSEVQQVLTFAKGVYTTSLHIMALKQERAQLVARKQRALSIDRNLQSGFAGSPDVVADQQTLADEVVSEHLFEARTLLRAYCYALRYRYPASFNDGNNECSDQGAFNAIGGHAGEFTAVLGKLMSISKDDMLMLIKTRDSGSGAGVSVPFDITYKFDLPNFRKTGQQSFSFELGEIPFLSNKLNVEVSKIYLFFPGLNRKLVTVDIGLHPPFYKADKKADASLPQPFRFVMPGLTQLYEYTNNASSCSESFLEGQVCTVYRWEANSFTLPTPFARWTVALPEFTESERNTIRSVRMVLHYTSTGTLPGLRTAISKGDWSACHSCQQTREVNCTTQWFTSGGSELSNKTTWHADVCTYGKEPVPSSQCCCPTDIEGQQYCEQPKFESLASECGRCLKGNRCANGLQCDSQRQVCLNATTKLPCSGFGLLPLMAHAPSSSFNAPSSATPHAPSSSGITNAGATSAGDALSAANAIGMQMCVLFILIFG